MLALINSSSSLTITSPTVGNSRWLAPEISDPQSPGAPGTPVDSMPADVFGFAMVAIEIFTGKVPFAEYSVPGAVRQILEGKRPALPQNAEDVGLTAQRWALLQRCWESDPAARPTMGEVVRMWGGQKRFWREWACGLS